LGVTSDRFRREALIQAKLTHPNIVTVNDFFFENDVCGIVMEFIEGETFDEILMRNGGPLDVNRVIQLFLPLLNALQVAHSNKVIHRDLKPENLILQNLQGVHIPKIMDFGIARALDESKRLTATGTKMGTQEYMSPEQCEGKSEITHLSDIYSMAVAMYEMLTGRVPFSNNSDYELMKAVITEPPPPIRQLNPLVPPWLEGVLMTAMQKEPTLRFASAGLFAKAISQQTQTPPPQSQFQPPRQVHQQHQTASPPMGSSIQTPISQKGKTVVDTSVGSPMATPSGGLSKQAIVLIFGIAILAVVFILSVLWIFMDKQNAPASPVNIAVKSTPPPTPVPTAKPYTPTPNTPTVEYNPSAAKSESAIAGRCFKQKNYLCAAEHFRNASQYEPNNGNHFDNVAYSYMKMGKWADCVSWARKAYNLANDYSLKGTSQRNVGKCLAKMGNYSEACRYYRDSLLARSNKITRKECNKICNDCP